MRANEVSPMSDPELTGANAKLGNASSQWAGLNKMITQAERTNFMFMGERAGWMDRFISSYKHSNTRRYLNVDQLGQCYQYVAETNTYKPIAAMDAIKHVFA